MDISTVLRSCCKSQGETENLFFWGNKWPTVINMLQPDLGTLASYKEGEMGKRKMIVILSLNFLCQTIHSYNSLGFECVLFLVTEREWLFMQMLFIPLPFTVCVALEKGLSLQEHLSLYL